MKVKHYAYGFCVVAKKNWDNYEEDAFVEWFTRDEDEAERVRASLSRADQMDFIIVEV